MITRRKHLLLNFLKIKVIVNGTEIYPIAKGEKIIIPVQFNNPKIVATDGYHITQPLELVFHHIHRYHFKIVCVIGDSQLAAGFVLIAVLFFVGMVSGLMVVRLLSVLPVFYFLFLYYINRKEFIQIRAS